VVALGFDVYGTLVDPLAMARSLEEVAGSEAPRFAALWREKQIEYTFRRGLMRRYVPFDVCTRQALLFTMQALQIPLSATAQEYLLEQYQHLPAYPDVLPALRDLRACGYGMVAFSNGTEAMVRTLLDHGGILAELDGVISVDDLHTYKPDPAVYAYLARRLDRAPGDTWLVSGNPFDVIGARAAGLKAAWLRRHPEAVFDHWEFAPDCVVPALTDLAAVLRGDVP
jgi:2-haloacid dehalogenase